MCTICDKLLPLQIRSLNLGLLYSELLLLDWGLTSIKHIKICHVPTAKPGKRRGKEKEAEMGKRQQGDRDN